jgi:hypothetical protein
VSPVLAGLVVLAHHLNGALALAFALPPILVVGGAVLWLRRREPAEDAEFEWSAEDDEFVHGRP